MTPEMMSRAICRKNSFLINRDGSTRVFRLMYFLEFATNHESHWEFQFIISEMLGHHNQGWPRNLHVKFFLSIDLLKELITLWRFNINVTDCVGITGYWFEAIFIISPKKNILFEIAFGSNILASFTEFQCQGTDTFGFIQVQTFEIHI